jgi:hypothetical protein
MRQIIHIADVSSWDNYRLLFKNVRHETVIGEGSNSYLFCPSSAQNISRQLPNAKILMILRNPVERAWSHYLMNRKLGHPILSDFLEEVDRDTNARPEGWGITANYFRLGLYSEQVKRFLSFFPRDQVEVIFYDDFSRAPQETLSHVFDFLNVDPTFRASINTEKNVAAQPRWPTLHKALLQSGLFYLVKRRMTDPVKTALEKLLLTQVGLPTLSALERRTLASLYDSDIRDLSALLDHCLDDWLR